MRRDRFGGAGGGVRGSGTQRGTLGADREPMGSGWAEKSASPQGEGSVRKGSGSGCGRGTGGCRTGELTRELKIRRLGARLLIAGERVVKCRKRKKVG